MLFDHFCSRLKGSDASWEHDEEPPQEVNIIIVIITKYFYI